MEDHKNNFEGRLRYFLSGLIRKVQDNPRETLPEISAKKVQVVGVTGAPFVGKSSLISRMLHYLRKDGKKVGVLAIDPSSFVSNGAFLGDCLRMRVHTKDDGVFIHSIASRGSRGGLPEGLGLMIKIMSVFADIVIVETVGSGQQDVEIAKICDTLVVVFEPSGDEVSAPKAGPWELAHLIVVNKADKDDHGFYESMKANILSTADFPQVFKTKISFGKDEGVKEVVEAIYKHWEYLNKAEGEKNV